MNGAEEYAKLFATGQYGRFYIVSSHHARGRTFHIQVLPKDERARSNGDNNLCLNDNAVEVYGIIGGEPGWNESYGWKYEGPWQADFEELIKRVVAFEAQVTGKLESALDQEKDKRERAADARNRELLASY